MSTHALLLALALAHSSPAACQQLMASGAAAAVEQWAARSEAAARWLPLSPLLKPLQPSQPCLLLLAWAQLLAGLGAGSWVVWWAERRSRRTFLLQLPGEQGGPQSADAPALLGTGWALLPLALLAAGTAWWAADAALLLQQAAVCPLAVGALLAAAAAAAWVAAAGGLG